MLRTKRLFLAIKVVPDRHFQNVFNLLKNNLQHESIKWVDAYNMHLTLKFFGETPLGKIEPIVFAVEKALRNVGMFELKMENIGIFGSHYQPKLIWAGVSNSEELKPLWDNIRLQLETIGYQSDRQNFVPHLTLGRIRKLSDKSLFQNIIEKHSKMKLQKVVVDKVILFESVLKKTGPTYNIIDEFSLKT